MRCRFASGLPWPMSVLSSCATCEPRLLGRFRLAQWTLPPERSKRSICLNVAQCSALIPASASVSGYAGRFATRPGCCPANARSAQGPFATGGSESHIPGRPRERGDPYRVIHQKGAMANIFRITKAGGYGSLLSQGRRQCASTTS